MSEHTALHSQHRTKFSAISLIAAIALVSPAAASGLFFTGGAQQYLSPDEPINDPSIGFRLGAGWEMPLHNGGGVSSPPRLVSA